VSSPHPDTLAAPAPGVAADYHAPGEIAFLPGFSGLSAFGRARKRRTGQAPARRRAEQPGAAPDDSGRSS